MKAQRPEGRRSLFPVLAAVSAVYLAVCLYAGWSGNIAFLQKESFHILPFLGAAAYARWSLHSRLSAMALVLCLYGLYRTVSQKKRYGTLVLCLFLAYLGSLLFSPGSGNLWGVTVNMGLFVGSMIAAANCPGMIHKAVTRYISEANSEDARPSLLGQIEWIRCFPLKKVLIAALWLFCPTVVVMGLVVVIREPAQDSGTYLAILLFLLMAVFTARKVWRYLTTPYHCIPVLRGVFSKEQLEALVQNEHFTPVSFENPDLQKYIPMLVSENWILLEGQLISRKLAACASVRCHGRGSRMFSRIEVIYLDGEQFETASTDIYLDGAEDKEMNQMLRGLLEPSLPYCAPEKIRQVYLGILPEIQDPKEKLWHLLTQDVSHIRQVYEEALAPKPQERKKSRRK